MIPGTSTAPVQDRLKGAPEAARRETKVDLAVLLTGTGARRRAAEVKEMMNNNFMNFTFKCKLNFTL